MVHIEIDCVAAYDSYLVDKLQFHKNCCVWIHFASIKHIRSVSLFEFVRSFAFFLFLFQRICVAYYTLHCRRICTKWKTKINVRQLKQQMVQCAVVVRSLQLLPKNNTQYALTQFVCIWACLRFFFSSTEKKEIVRCTANGAGKSLFAWQINNSFHFVFFPFFWIFFSLPAVFTVSWKKKLSPKRIVFSPSPTFYL